MWLRLTALAIPASPLAVVLAVRLIHRSIGAI